jgi:LAGLIDADG DNA endonuclease family protein
MDKKIPQNIKNMSFSKDNIYLLNVEKNTFLIDNQKYNNSQFAYYLAGLIEGDGSIIVPASLRDIKGKHLYPVIKITFAEKDLPLAEKLNSILKMGKIYKEKGKYFNLVFYKLEVIFLIVQMIQGKMRTPKIEALNRLIDWFKIKYNINIDKNYLDISYIGSNAWLAGFLDTDGSFYSHFCFNKKNIPIQIKCYMQLSQRQIYSRRNNQVSLDQKNFTEEYIKRAQSAENDYSYVKIMNEIMRYLNVSNLRTINRIRTKEYTELGYEIRTLKIESNKILINYLDKYPLFSSKYLDYLDWKDIFEMKINKKYKSKEGGELLVSLKSSMNKNRSKFDWKHLDYMWKI